MFKEMTPGKKKLIYIAIAVIVLAVIIFFIWRSRKKKKNEKEAAEKISNLSQPTELKTPTAPKMQIVPDEDNNRGKQPAEAPMSVAQVIPESKPEKKSGAPGTLGVPGNGSTAAPTKKPVASSSLPPEFMMNANNPNADPGA